MTPPENRDRNFDDLGDRLARNIYGSPKGQIRLKVLWWHLLKHLPQLQSGPAMTVLDAGCGMGQMAARLVALGHDVSLCDVSADMLLKARDLIEQQAGQQDDLGRAHYFQQALQDMPGLSQQGFDVVLCHAVLEWLAEPQQAIAAMARLVSAGGYLSLMFYNRDALIYRNLIRGNLHKVKSGNYAGHHGGLTPSNPLHPPEVYAWLEQQGFKIKSLAGVRVFYDFIPSKPRQHLSLEDIIELEIEYSQQQPFQSLARYIHVLAERQSDNT